MKHKILFFLFIFNIVLIQSQSKTDTQKWIKETYEKYRRPENVKNWIEFLNGEIVNSSSSTYFERLKISDIKKIRVKKDFLNTEQGKIKWYSIELYCEDDTQCAKREYLDGKTDKIIFMSILLDSSFEEENLPSRMEKAWIYLVKSYGGNAVLKKDTF